MVGIDLAEMKLEKGDSAGAEEIAQRMLVDPNGDQGGAYYLLARLAVMQSDPDEAIAYFEQALKLSKDPRTLAWSHIYLGRLYDTQPDRAKAMAEYRAALAVHDANPDTQTAAESGLQKAFVLPKRAQPPPAEEDGPLDPSGKAEKDAYRPDSAK
jgi:tetratricopeptide (TPR) repeat protein